MVSKMDFIFSGVSLDYPKVLVCTQGLGPELDASSPSLPSQQGVKYTRKKRQWGECAPSNIIQSITTTITPRIFSETKNMHDTD